MRVQGVRVCVHAWGGHGGVCAPVGECVCVGVCVCPHRGWRCTACVLGRCGGSCAWAGCECMWVGGCVHAGCVCVGGVYVCSSACVTRTLTGPQDSSSPMGLGRGLPKPGSSIPALPPPAWPPWWPVPHGSSRTPTPRRQQDSSQALGWVGNTRTLCASVSPGPQHGTAPPPPAQGTAGTGCTSSWGLNELSGAASPQLSGRLRSSPA